MRFISPLPRQLAVSRLKANLFLLFLSLLVRTVFTPYTTLRRGIEQLGDEFWQRGLVRKGFWSAGGSCGKHKKPVHHVLVRVGGCGGGVAETQKP